jgi:hypothetical protein
MTNKQQANQRHGFAASADLPYTTPCQNSKIFIKNIKISMLA